MVSTFINSFVTTHQEEESDFVVISYGPVANEFEANKIEDTLKCNEEENNSVLSLPNIVKEFLCSNSSRKYSTMSLNKGTSNSPLYKFFLFVESSRNEIKNSSKSLHDQVGILVEKLNLLGDSSHSNINDKIKSIAEECWKHAPYATALLLQFVYGYALIDRNGRLFRPAAFHDSMHHRDTCYEELDDDWVAVEWEDIVLNHSIYEVRSSTSEEMTMNGADEEDASTEYTEYEDNEWTLIDRDGVEKGLPPSIEEMIAILRMSTDQILSLSQDKMENFCKWLESSRIPGSSELFAALQERRKLQKESEELERQIFETRKRRAASFGLVGKLLFWMIYSPPAG